MAITRTRPSGGEVSISTRSSLVVTPDHDELARLARLVDDMSLQPVVGRTFFWPRAQRIRNSDGPRKPGKTVLVVRQNWPPPTACPPPRAVDRLPEHPRRSGTNRDPLGGWTKAQTVRIHLTDDLDGTPASETIRFAVDGVEYEIDLNDANAETLRRTADPYIVAVRAMRTDGVQQPPQLWGNSSSMPAPGCCGHGSWLTYGLIVVETACTCRER